MSVIAVILYHARDLLPGGFVGVDAFFVVSGFVITRSLINEHRTSGRVGLLDFYRRRVRRLTPMLTVAVVVVVVASAALAPLASLRRTALTGLAASLLGANAYLARTSGYFTESAELNPLLHTWSLSLEEQFYLVFPVIFIALVRRAGDGSHRYVRIGLTTLSVLSFALSIVLSNGFLDVIGAASGARLSFFMMPTRAWQFGVGALLATYPDAVFQRRGGSAARGLTGAALLALSFVVLDDGLPYPGYWALLPTAATALLLSAPVGPTATALAGRPMVRMGDVSYSWYLWHWPAIVFAYALGLDARVGLALVGLSSYGLATVTYSGIETRFRRPTPGTSRGSSWIAITATGIVSVAIASVGLIAWSSDGLPREAELAQAARRSHADRTCDRVDLGPGVPGCRFGDGPGRLLLAGDSNAGHLAESAIETGAALGYAVEVVTESACPLLPIDVRNDGELDERCAARSASMLAWLHDDPPDVFVYAAAADIHVSLEGRTLARDGLAGPDAFSDGLDALLAPLLEGPTTIVAVLPIPKFSLEPDAVIGAERCSVVALSISSTGCQAVIDRAAAERQRAPGVKAMLAALEPTRAIVFDPLVAVCPGDPCTEFTGDFWTYRDARHISVAMAETLREPMTTAVRSALDGQVPQ